MFKSRDNEAMADAMNIYHNSAQHFVIGPVFAKNLTRAEVIAKIEGWIDICGSASWSR